MPLIKEIKLNNAAICLWHIIEEHHFFLDALDKSAIEIDLAGISNSKKQLEFLASRYLVKQLAGAEYLAALNKTENGKPFFFNYNETLSISHSTTHAAVIFSNYSSCGVDIETISPRVHKIATRFLSVEELTFIDERYFTECITLLWSAKETIYKWYGKGNLSFSNQINLLRPFRFEDRGTLHFALNVNDIHFNVEVYYEKIDSQILTYTI